MGSPLAPLTTSSPPGGPTGLAPAESAPVERGAAERGPAESGRAESAPAGVAPAGGALALTVTAARWRRVRRAGLGDPRPVAGLILLGLFVVLAVFPDRIAPWDPTFQELSRRLQPPVWQSGDPTFLLGGDPLGRDLWSRLVQGARVSMSIGLMAVAGSMVVGVTLGLIAGYFGGIVDNAIMGITELQLAFPFILLAITIVSIAPPSLPTLIAILALSAWVVYARLIRGRVLSVREQDFVEAARALGADTPRLLLRHILPQLLPPIIVVATLELGRIIVLEATLSFLGFGVQAPDISWGQILAGGRPYIATAWWVSAFAGLAIALLVLAINTVGDWLAEVLDPSARGVA
jgi:peptide/nickel transport system permease protein